MNTFFEKNFNVLQEDNRNYLQENGILKEKLFKMHEKLNKKTILVKTLRENEILLKEAHAIKIREKDQQIERLMKIMSILPEVYLEKIEERGKTFHNMEKNLEKEKNILKEMYNNIENPQKTAQKNLRNNSLRQKKLSWFIFKLFFMLFFKISIFWSDVTAKFDFQGMNDPQTTKNQDKTKENGINLLNFLFFIQSFFF